MVKYPQSNNFGYGSQVNQDWQFVWHQVVKIAYRQYNLKGGIEIEPTENGLLISAKKQSRKGWTEQLTSAIDKGQLPDDELLEGFTDEFTETEWNW